MSQKNSNSESGSRICGQLAAIMADVDAVGKDGRNSQQGFNFRKIEDVMDLFHPIFAKHKVFILPEVLEDKAEERQTQKGGTLIYRILKVRFAFVSGDDGSREFITTVGEGMDSGDKAANKAMTAAYKYALTQMVILPYSGMDDGDSDTPPPIAPKKAATPTPAATPQPGNLRSAYDGREIQPGESPLPKAAAPPARPPTPQPSDGTAFHGALYDRMKQTNISPDELTAYLRKRGLIAGTQTIHTLSGKLVTAMLEGTDAKTQKRNWDLIVNGIREGRAK